MLTIFNIENNGDGSVTVSWAGGKAPYTLCYAEKHAALYEDVPTDLTTMGLLTAKTDLTSNSYKLCQLVPGHSYWIVLRDSTGFEQFQAFDVEPVAEAVCSSPRLEITPLVDTDGDFQTIPYIPVESILLDDDVIYDAQVDFYYSNPGKTRQAMIQLVYILPNGASCVDSFGYMTLEHGDACCISWPAIDLESYLDMVRERFGEIPNENVQLQVYVNGQMAACAPLPLSEPQAPTITGIAAKGNGTYQLSWQDNGMGPYTVYFQQRFSEDMQADRQDARGSGFWREHQDITESTVQMSNLLPGQQYWLIVKDSKGNQGSLAFDVPAAAASSLNISVDEVHPLMKSEILETNTELVFFSAEALEQTGYDHYGFYLALSYNELAQDIQVHTQWTITLPDGVTFTSDNFDCTFFAGSGSFWDFFNISWALGHVKYLYDELLTGGYRIDLYVDGCYATGFTFTIVD